MIKRIGTDLMILFSENKESASLLGDVIGGIETHDAADIAGDCKCDEQHCEETGSADGNPCRNGTWLQISLTHHYNSLIYQYAKRSAD